MQKHSERTDKRPPIVASRPVGGNGPAGSGSLGAGPSNGVSVVSMNSQLSNVTGPLGENPYWPKVSPDSVTNTLSEVLQQQQQQQASHHQQLSQQTSLQHHHQMQHDFGLQPPTDLQGHQRDAESVENLTAGSSGGSRQTSTSALNGSHNYDKSSALSNSAFTPIQSMTPHLNSLGHHHHHHHHAQLGQRPYLYDAINFGQNKGGNQMGGSGNSFPNQLISLHQIRNYAHQPGTLMSGEHLLGVSVGPGKEKC